MALAIFNGTTGEILSDKRYDRANGALSGARAYVKAHPEVDPAAVTIADDDMVLCGCGTGLVAPFSDERNAGHVATAAHAAWTLDSVSEPVATPEPTVPDDDAATIIAREDTRLAANACPKCGRTSALKGKDGVTCKWPLDCKRAAARGGAEHVTEGRVRSARRALADAPAVEIPDTVRVLNSEWSEPMNARHGHYVRIGAPGDVSLEVVRQAAMREAVRSGFAPRIGSIGMPVHQPDGTVTVAFWFYRRDNG